MALIRSLNSFKCVFAVKLDDAKIKYRLLSTIKTIETFTIFVSINHVSEARNYLPASQLFIELFSLGIKESNKNTPERRSERRPKSTG